MDRSPEAERDADMADYKVVSKKGSIRTLHIEGLSLSDIPNEFVHVWDMDGFIKLNVGNNDQMAKISAIIERKNAAPVVSEPKKSGARRIELATVAESKNMNHGKIWTANWKNVDSGMVPPEYEGELVCYVYSD